MEKGTRSACTGPGYNECGIQYTQRLTYDGEYLHARRGTPPTSRTAIDSSNGCTNLYTADAKKLYDFLEVGDVVKYPNANGPLMQLGDGLRRLERAVGAVADRRALRRRLAASRARCDHHAVTLHRHGMLIVESAKAVAPSPVGLALRG